MRNYADAIGTTAKTDRVDARVLAQFGFMLSPDVTVLNSEAVEELKELESARWALIKARTALANRTKNLSIKLLHRQAEIMREQLDAQIAEIDKAAHNIIANEPELKQRFDIICSIPGLGPATALSILALMPELGHLNEKQIASLAGLAPVARDSGKFSGKRICKGGRRHLRRALYMPALVATRFNADLRKKYQILIECGKPAKVAITAVMRKLIVLANALIRDNRKWSAEAP